MENVSFARRLTAWVVYAVLPILAVFGILVWVALTNAQTFGQPIGLFEALGRAWSQFWVVFWFGLAGGFIVWIFRGNGLDSIENHHYEGVQLVLGEEAPSPRKFKKLVREASVSPKFRDGLEVHPAWWVKLTLTGRW